MFRVNEDKSIYVTRGDEGALNVSTTLNEGLYTFQENEKLIFKVFEKKNCNNVVLSKTVPVIEPTQEVQIVFGKDENGVPETRLGEVINKPIDYWYEIELVDVNGRIQTIIGYDEDGAKIFRLFPEGSKD